MKTNVKLDHKKQFQEYEQAVEKLRIAYFSNKTDIDAIKRANIALLSDANFGDSVIKAVVLQTIANNNNKNSAQNQSQKNTFLFRFLYHMESQLESVQLIFHLFHFWGFVECRFSVDTNLNLIKILNQINFDGAGHLDDLCYIFQ